MRAQRIVSLLTGHIENNKQVHETQRSSYSDYCTVEEMKVTDTRESESKGRIEASFFKIVDI